MNNEDEKAANLVPSPSHELLLAGSTSLVQRGMQDLIDAEEAERWLNRGLELSGERRYEEAALWYRKAAERGLASAQLRLGWSYECGCGVPQDDNQAALWYREGADQGDANLQLALALMYLEGKGVPHDAERAIFWLRKSAYQGDVGAQSKLASIYEAGEIVPQDYAQAAYWYLKVAVLDHHCSQDAQSRLGHMYENGLGVPKDPEQAARWYREAEQGDRLAKAALAATVQRFQKLSPEATASVLNKVYERVRINLRPKPSDTKPQS